MAKHERCPIDLIFEELNNEINIENKSKYKQNINW